MRVTPCSIACCDERRVVAPGGQADDLEGLGGALDDVERLGADGARGAQDEKPLHGDSLWQRRCLGRIRFAAMELRDTGGEGRRWCSSTARSWTARCGIRSSRGCRDRRCLVPSCRSARTPSPVADRSALTPVGVADLIADRCSTARPADVTLVGNDTGGGLAQLVVTRRAGADREARADALRRAGGLPARRCSSRCSRSGRFPLAVGGRAWRRCASRPRGGCRSPSAG